MKIVTEYVHSPISIHIHSYMCYDADEDKEGPCVTGCGPTREAALDALVEKIQMGAYAEGREDALAEQGCPTCVTCGQPWPTPVPYPFTLQQPSEPTDEQIIAVLAAQYGSDWVEDDSGRKTALEIARVVLSLRAAILDEMAE